MVKVMEDGKSIYVNRLDEKKMTSPDKMETELLLECLVKESK